MQRRILPGFPLTMSITLGYLMLMVIIPLAACFLKASSLSLQQFVDAAWTDRARAAYTFSIGTSLIAAAINSGVGLLMAWVLVRYEFPFKRVLDALVDLPFALPTAVAGLVYSSLYVQDGWLGRFLVPMGIEAAYTPLAVVLVLVFVGLPFVVRTIQPVLESIEADVEEAAFLMGASRLQIFFRVLLPQLMPAIITGFALAFSRSLGEYGSVVFVSGNMPFKTEIAPVLIVAKLEEFHYAEATAIAVVLLVLSFSMLMIINKLEVWSKRHEA
jgi:sulfate/thiosulfate transport system permease protein